MLIKINKKILAVGLFVILSVLGACTAIPPVPDVVEENTNEITTDDLMGFSLAYENTYCDLMQVANGFWEDMNSTEFDGFIEANGNDVPKMRAIGNKYQTMSKSLNLPGRVDSFNNSKLNENFSESIRHLRDSNEYLQSWIDGNAYLSSFEQFKNIVIPKLQSFNVASEFIPDAYRREFGYLIYEIPELDNQMTSVLSDVEVLCQSTMQLMVSKKPKESFIKLKNDNEGTITRESDNAFRIYGETSDNCSKIVVETYDNNDNLYDHYQLSQYKYGNTSFKYGIREDWNNLKIGRNTYKFSAYCDNAQIKEVSTLIEFGIPTPVPTFTPEKEYESFTDTNTYSGLSNDNYYTNSEGNEVHSPAYSNTVPAGASARCRDGTYSFSQNRRGTCSGHGGVASWL